jgi:hypothetical protein
VGLFLVKYKCNKDDCYPASSSSANELGVGIYCPKARVGALSEWPYILNAGNIWAFSDVVFLETQRI